MSQDPATAAGSTRPAGEGVDDDELSKEVAGQTSSDLAVEAAFERQPPDEDAVESAKANASDF